MHDSKSSGGLTVHAADAHTQIQWPRGRLGQAAILLLGLVLPQVVLFWPSLCGFKILLPLDLLQLDAFYLPVPPEWRPFRSQNPVLLDQVLAIEPFRRYAVDEVRAGRLPLWNPYSYCGTPFLAANQSAIFSPFRALDYLFPGTWVLAWNQLLKTLVVGVGAYLFFRRAVQVSYWPATIGACCFPLCGFMMQWQGYPLSQVVAWLPWVLLGTAATVRRPWGAGPIGLAIVTAAMLFSGHAAMAAQVLLAAGLYGLWCMLDEFPGRRLATPRALAAGSALAAAWGLGALVSAPQSLPTAEYMQHSHRLATRQSGYVESPGVGVTALPQFVIPDFYGSERKGIMYFRKGNRLESAASGYIGLMMTFFLAPLGWQSRRHRAQYLFWLVAGFLGASQVLDVPVLRKLFQLYPLTLLRNNRFVFLTAWAVLTMGVVGLEALSRQAARWRYWCWLPSGLAASLGLWCGWRVFNPVATVAKLKGSLALQSYVATAAVGFTLCALVVVLWDTLRREAWDSSRKVLMLGILLVAEPLYFAYHFNPQCDPALNYPDLPALEAIRNAPPGRMTAARCLPPCLNLVKRLRAIHGYDGVDPAEYIELIDCYRINNKQAALDPNALTSYLENKPSPVMDLLNVRYIVHRGVPTKGLTPMLVANDYFVVESKTHLPRAFVPRRIEVAADKAQRLRLLSRDDFQPREVAYVETNVTLPAPAQGQAEIVVELPTELTLAVRMQTPGCLVIADGWASGWKAYFEGRELPVLRVNHALRGVVLPAGTGRLVMRYEPREFYLGLRLCGAALIVLLVWSAVLAGVRLRALRHSFT